MASVLQPETPTGSYRVVTPPRAEPPQTRARLDHVDLLRGLVMVIMVLDHIRAYALEVRFDPTDLTQTWPALFATRWITHFCAPTFVLLAGASAWIAGTRRTRPELARFLASRGAWLILVELTVVTFGWYFTAEWTMGAIAQVIWVIGASMIVLAGLIHLPRVAIAGFGLALVAGHNLFDGITPERFGALEPLWRVLHVSGPLESLPVLLLYPLVPWAGVMALGYVAGPLIFSRAPGASRRLAWLGGALVVAFVVLRTLDVYGDASRRLTEGDPALLVMSFLNLTKYPPSLLFLLMTLGPALLALGLLRPGAGALSSMLVTFGRVPFLFYIAHIYLMHAAAVAVGVIQGFAPSQLFSLYFDFPTEYGVGLPTVYLLWILLVAALYPLCRRYAAYRARSRAWWLSYL